MSDFKKLIYITLICLTFNCHSQFLFVSNPTVLPVNPTTSSNIKIATRVTTPSIGWKVSSSYNIQTPTSTIELKSSYCDGLMPGGIAINDTVTIGNLAAGVWTVNFRAYYGSQFLTNCGITDSVLKTITFTISIANSIKENGTFDGFNVYPNPSSNIFSLELVTNQNKNLVLCVSDILGREVYKEIKQAIPGENSFKINLNANQNGIYFLTVSDGVEKYKTFKLIKN